MAISKNKGIINAYIFERGSGVNTTNKNGQINGKKKLEKLLNSQDKKKLT